MQRDRNRKTKNFESSEFNQLGIQRRDKQFEERSEIIERRQRKVIIQVESFTNYATTQPFANYNA